MSAPVAPVNNEPTMALQRRQWLRLAGACAIGAAAPGWAQSPAGTPTLDKLRARGSLSVAVYQDLPPFHVAGQGI